MTPDPAAPYPGEPYRRSLWQISAFALSIQCSLTLFYLVASASTEYRISDAVLLIQLSIGILLLVVPDLITHRGRAADDGSRLGVGPWTAIVASLLVAAGLVFSRLELPAEFSRLPALALSLAGPAAALAHFAVYLRQRAWWRSLFVVVVGLVFGVYLGLVVWGTGYHSPYFSERMLAGVANIDTMFHAAVAGLLQTHGFPTIGLDGVIPLKYHTGSHLAFGSLAALSRISVIDFYSVSYPIIFLPLFFKALLLAALDLARAGLGPWNARWSAALAAILFASLGWPWFSHPFVSESTTVGLIVGLLLLSTTLRHAGARWFYFAAFALGWLAVYCKISVGVPAFVCLAFLFVRRREYRAVARLAQFAVYGALAIILTWGLVFSLRPNLEDGEAFSLFDVVSSVFEYSPPVVILFLSWIVAGGLLLARRRPSATTLPDNAAPRLAWEVLSVLALSTLASAAFVWRDASDATYFLMTYFFLSLPFLTVQAQEVMARAGLLGRLAAPLLAFTLACLAVRTDVLADYREANRFRAAAEKEQRSAEELELAARRLEERAGLFEALAGLDLLPRSEKRAAAVFVPRSNEPYWTLREEWPAAHFLVQALTGMAMIGGQRAEIFDDELYPYPTYGLLPYRRQRYGETVTEALAAARRLGYESLVVVDFDGGGFVVSRRAP